MSGRWSTLLMDSAELARLPQLPMGEIAGHGEKVLSRRLNPKELYRRWETQQWSAEAVELEPDHAEIERLPGRVRNGIRDVVLAFVMGEYTGLDLLGPITLGCPDEESLLYLGTQVADESRHTVMMARIATEVFGAEADLARLLPEVWRTMTPAHRELSSFEAALVEDLVARPSDYARWLRAVTHFHLITEGVLALYGQKGLIRGLRRHGALAGVQTGFIAMTRDESRHVSFGMHALRQGLREGHHDAIVDVLETCAPLAVNIEARPGVRPALAEFAKRELTRELHRRLEQLDLPEKTIEHVLVVAGRNYVPAISDAEHER